MHTKQAQEMRAAESQYLDRAHPTKKYVPATKKAVLQLAKRSRVERKDYWTKLEKMFPATKGAKITATKIKEAFRTYMDAPQNGRCCYCRAWLMSNAYARPVEHILPRSSYPHYSMHFWNLAVACVDCNTEKKDAVWGAIPKTHRFYPSSDAFTDSYHARFHQYDDHVKYVILETNAFYISLYRGLTKQGRHLCTELLDTIAARRMVFSTNPVLRAAKKTIEDHKKKMGALPTSAVDEFQASLNTAVQKFIS